MTEPMKWGILGYARIARTQVLPAIVEAENAQPYAIASRDGEKLKEAKNAFGFEKTYQDYDALLSDPEVEAVYIPLPNALHKEWTLKAIAAGKHVLCEKPLALTAEDCQELLEAAGQKGVLLGEAFMYRFARRAQIVKKLLEEGAIGQVRSIYASHRFVLQNPDSIKLKPELGGGSLWDVGCYPVNLIGMILQAEPEQVCAQKVERGGVDYALSAVLRYPGGVLCTLSCGFDSQCDLLAEIGGTEGTLIFTNAFGDTDEPIRLVQNGETRMIPVPACHRYTMEIEAFSQAARTGAPLPYSAQEAVRNTRVIQRILEAAK